MRCEYLISSSGTEHLKSRCSSAKIRPTSESVKQISLSIWNLAIDHAAVYPMPFRPDALIAYLIAHRPPYLVYTTRNSCRLPSPRVTYNLARALVHLRCDLQAYSTRNISCLPHDTHSPSSARASAERLNRALPRKAHTGAVIYSLRSQMSTAEQVSALSRGIYKRRRREA
ncbi:uncharacterized protein SCHCODRAFT_02217218 [Schizophyllum commune H4-8]|uniref:uncharacterized protein n=1 Tax=Schizophyllum commune (strain H4-8 / FGSC 9210) TaxID=578458 RepID=UPI0021600D45|nr:uncharacterized protein SCHCODRAFT_02217218 [Schizophyllum commune H4-8]KAI5894851.1 hypothetical protein SCHCODRAFT_02217218 [Schizophyllum commune H4-8]